MLGHWRKINIDDYISHLAEFYGDCSKPNFRTAGTVDTVNQEEALYLNANINLEKLVGVEKKYILNKVLVDRTKFNFAKHILTSLNISLEVNSIDASGKSTFQLFFENAEALNEYYFRHQIIYLYKRGYKHVQSDETYLKDVYKNKFKNQQHFEMWCSARICFKLNDFEKIEMAFAKDRTILTILSFKQGKPVGFNYSNLLEVANNAMKNYREHGDLILYAMKYYNAYSNIKERDKKGTFSLKEQDFYTNKPIQDREFNEIVYEIFSELKPQ